MKVRKITAWITFDDPVDREEAIQTLAESVADDCADISFDYDDPNGGS